MVTRFASGRCEFTCLGTYSIRLRYGQILLNCEESSGWYSMGHLIMIPWKNSYPESTMVNLRKIFELCNREENRGFEQVANRSSFEENLRVLVSVLIIELKIVFSFFVHCTFFMFPYFIWFFFHWFV